MYKNILVSQKELILLEQILNDSIKNRPNDSKNIHILIRHICGQATQYNVNKDTICGKSTINQI